MAQKRDGAQLDGRNIKAAGFLCKEARKQWAALSARVTPTWRYLGCGGTSGHLLLTCRRSTVLNGGWNFSQKRKAETRFWREVEYVVIFENHGAAFWRHSRRIWKDRKREREIEGKREGLVLQGRQLGSEERSIVGILLWLWKVWDPGSWRKAISKQGWENVATSVA